MGKMNLVLLKIPIKFWKSILLIVLPFGLIPLPVILDNEASRCGYVLLLVAFFWMTEALPLAVTALIPVFAFPLLGIMTTAEVCAAYMNRTVMMFLGGLIIAVSLEYSNLHKRIALLVILYIGQSPRRLMAGFMLTTMILSMWISNAAACAMMVPLVSAILEEVVNMKEGNLESELLSREKNETALSINDSNEETPSRNNLEIGEVKIKDFKSDLENLEREKTALKNMYFLATAYAGNIGGTATPLGSGANLVTKNLFQSGFEEETGLNFGSWLVFNTPGILINTFLAWLWLQYYFLDSGSNQFSRSSEKKQKSVRELIKNKLKEMGHITFHEKVIIALFVLALLLWFMRSPGFIVGWADVLEPLFGWEIKVSDATATLFIVVLLFTVPRKLSFWPFVSVRDSRPSEGCLTWEVVEEKVSWGSILLLGGGFAIAKGADKSGLSSWLGEQLVVVGGLPQGLVVLLVSTMTALTTEIASNTATASILMPILKDLSLSICMNPMYVIIPATACCCYAFMLPVATPPNVLVYNVAKMKTIVMIKAGIVMNVICVIVINIMINTLGIAMFDVHHFPSWANSSTSSTPVYC